jgi:hypothetical protein
LALRSRGARRLGTGRAQERIRKALHAPNNVV